MPKLTTTGRGKVIYRDLLLADCAAAAIEQVKVLDRKALESLV